MKEIKIMMDCLSESDLIVVVFALSYYHAFDEDEDAVVIDETRIRTSQNYKSGIFASYHKDLFRVQGIEMWIFEVIVAG